MFPDRLFSMRVLFTGLTFFGLAAAAPLAQEVLTNADIVKMSSLQLSSQAIVLKIENSVTRFDTSPEGLAVLKAAGVPDLVIEANAEGVGHAHLVNIILAAALERYGMI